MKKLHVKLCISLVAFCVCNFAGASVTNVPVSDDSNTRGGSSADTNYGDSTTIRIKDSSNASFSRATYLKFDLSAYSSVRSAKLFFYGRAQVRMDVNAHAVNNDSWSESSLTWNNAPPISTNYGSVQVSTTDQWYEIDVSSGVQNEVASGNGLFSVGLVDSNRVTKTVTLFSKENSQSQFSSYLEIDGETTGGVVQRDVYLIIGQSNTAGRGAVEAKDRVVLDGVDLFNGQTWIPAENPMNAFSNIRKDLDLQQLSYAYTFGRTLNEVTGNRIGLIVNAIGGTRISQWQKGADDAFFESTMERVTDALAIPGTTLRGVLWHQGESNRNSNSYLSNIEDFINDIRSDLGISDLPFIAGQLSQERTDNNTFNENIKSLPTLVNDTNYVSSHCLGTTDTTHFDSNGQRILGSRYAAKMLEMVYDRELKTVRVPVDEDAYVRGGTNANDNYGVETLVRVKNASENTTRIGFLKFDLSSIDGEIIDANLFVNGGVQSGSESIDIGLFETTDNWSESSITWNDRPALGNQILAQTINQDSFSTHELCVSEYTQEANDNVVSFGLESISSGIEQLRLRSKEDISNQSDSPFLLIDYID